MKRNARQDWAMQDTAEQYKISNKTNNTPFE